MDTKETWPREMVAIDFGVTLEFSKLATTLSIDTEL